MDNYYNNQQPYISPSGYRQQYFNKPKKEYDGNALASVILGLVSIFFGTGVLTAFIGLFLGIKSKSRMPEQNGLAVLGILINIASIIFSIIAAVLVIIFWHTVSHYVKEFLDSLLVMMKEQSYTY